MKPLRFTCDKNKSKANQKKHGISFEEAQTVFFDENAIEFFDPDHSESEDRFLILGLSSSFRTLVVSHCYRKRESLIRIISARKTTKKEQRAYTGGQ